MDKTNWKQTVVYATIGLAAYAGYRTLRGVGVNEDQLIQGEMPPCDSSPVRQLLAKTIEQSPHALTSGLKLLQIGGVEDYLDGPDKPKQPEALDPNTTLRFCKSTVFTNAGQGDVHFNLTWIDATKTRLWLQVTVVTF